MKTITINLIVLRAADLDRAARFYGALGITLALEQHGSGPQHLAAQLGAAVLEIYPQADKASTAAVRLGFQVPSVDVAVAAVQEVGGAVITPPQQSPWGRRAVVADPDGHRIEVTEG